MVVIVKLNSVAYIFKATRWRHHLLWFKFKFYSVAKFHFLQYQSMILYQNIPYKIRIKSFNDTHCGKSSKSVQCAITGQCLHMCHMVDFRVRN